MSSLEDRRSFTTTQYLLFPLRDPTKKPQLIRFPEDLKEENWKDDSVWGSDTSLEEEIDVSNDEIENQPVLVGAKNQRWY